jgi:putative phosphoesterase
MKIAFISDIHGNAIALDAVMADLQQKKVDQIYVLGDLCYRGPEPKRALEVIRSLDAEVIKGNADEWVVRGVKKGEVPDHALELMNQERDWTVSQLDEEDLDYLKQLPTDKTIQVENVTIHAFHATPDSLFDVVLPHMDDDIVQEKIMSKKVADIYVYAHIHKPYIRYINGKIVMNIGSVGLPFDGMPKASYAMVEIDNGNIRTSIERVNVDIEKVVKKYQEVNYPNAEMMIDIVRKGSL